VLYMIKGVQPGVSFGRGHLSVAMRAERTRAGVSQLAVARECKLHESSITLVETGRLLITDERLQRIEVFLGSVPGTLVGAAAKDRKGLKLPTGIEDRDDLAVALALSWRALSPKKIAAIWAAVRAA
jgi:transcriptional regulator with XRE-family HTH domain